MTFLHVLKLISGKYVLKINGETIIATEKLSEIVIKIEQYLKLKYLPPDDKNFFEKLKGGFK